MSASTPSGGGSPTGAARVLLERHRAFTGTAAAVLCAALAVLWTVVVPDEAAQTSPPRSTVIRFGHPLCWALLSLAAVMFAARAPRRPIAAVAWTALTVYAAFVLALLL